MQIAIPAECRLDPLAPAEVAEPTLPPLPVANAPDYLVVRTKRAEAAGLFFQGQRDAERDARVTNAETQKVCSAWAKGQ